MRKEFLPHSNKLFLRGRDLLDKSSNLESSEDDNCDNCFNDEFTPNIWSLRGLVGVEAAARRVAAFANKRCLIGKDQKPFTFLLQKSGRQRAGQIAGRRSRGDTRDGR